MLSNWFCTSILTFPSRSPLSLIPFFPQQHRTTQGQGPSCCPLLTAGSPLSSEQGCWILKSFRDINSTNLPGFPVPSSLFCRSHKPGVPCFPHREHCTGKELFPCFFFPHREHCTGTFPMFFSSERTLHRKTTFRTLQQQPHFLTCPRFLLQFLQWEWRHSNAGKPSETTLRKCWWGFSPLAHPEHTCICIWHMLV